MDRFEPPPLKCLQKCDIIKNRKAVAILNNEKKEIAINTHLWFCVAFIMFFLILSTFGIREKEIWSSIGFAIASLLPLFVFLISPMYYVFSDESVAIIYLWGQKEEIKWISVRNVTLSGSWISRGGATPHYHIAYPTNKKRAFFINEGYVIKRYYSYNIF